MHRWYKKVTPKSHSFWGHALLSFHHSNSIDKFSPTIFLLFIHFHTCNIEDFICKWNCAVLASEWWKWRVDDCVCVSIFVCECFFVFVLTYCCSMIALCFEILTISEYRKFSLKNSSNQREWYSFSVVCLYLFWIWDANYRW